MFPVNTGTVTDGEGAREMERLERRPALIRHLSFCQGGIGRARSCVCVSHMSFSQVQRDTLTTQSDYRYILILPLPQGET